MAHSSKFMRLASNGIRGTHHTTAATAVRIPMTQFQNNGIVSNSTIPQHHESHYLQQIGTTVRWHNTQKESSSDVLITKVENTNTTSAASSVVIDNASGIEQDDHDHSHDHDHDHDHDTVDDDDDMEQEEMFVQPHISLGQYGQVEWGGPTRGGRLSEPTRFGDWERKGRCTDF